MLSVLYTNIYKPLQYNVYIFALNSELYLVWCWFSMSSAQLWLFPGINMCVCVYMRVSDSLRPHGLYPSRLLCPWNSSGKNTGASCHFLLQGIFPSEGLNPSLLPASPALAGRFLTTWATWEAPGATGPLKPYFPVDSLFIYWGRKTLAIKGQIVSILGFVRWLLLKLHNTVRAVWKSHSI